MKGGFLRIRSQLTDGAPAMRFFTSQRVFFWPMAAGTADQGPLWPAPAVPCSVRRVHQNVLCLVGAS